MPIVRRTKRPPHTGSSHTVPPGSPLRRHWFHGKSRKDQAAYIKAHPNSKYAKEAATKSGKVKAPVKAVKAAVKSDVKTKALITKLREQIKVVRERIASYKTKGIKGPRLINARHKLEDMKARLALLKGGTAKPVKKPAKTNADKMVAAVKAHAAKRVADKNKVIAKTPSAKAKAPAKKAVKPLSMFDKKKAKWQSNIKAKRTQLAKLKPGGIAHTRVKAELAKLRAELKRMI